MVVEAEVARTGPAILQALQEVTPGEAKTFAGEYRDALRRAAASLDVSEAEEVLTRWWGGRVLAVEPAHRGGAGPCSAARGG